MARRFNECVLNTVLFLLNSLGKKALQNNNLIRTKTEMYKHFSLLLSVNKLSGI